VNNSARIDPDRQYSIGVASKLLGLSASTPRDLERRGQLECTRTPGGQRRVPGAELVRFLETSRVESPKHSSCTSTPRRHEDDSSAHRSWLGLWISKAQQSLPLDASPEIRLRAGARLERALRGLGPETDGADIERVVAGAVQQAVGEALMSLADYGDTQVLNFLSSDL
jgi:excisionase family DNA binding protein